MTIECIQYIKVPEKPNFFYLNLPFIYPLWGFSSTGDIHHSCPFDGLLGNSSYRESLFTMPCVSGVIIGTIRGPNMTTTKKEYFLWSLSSRLLKSKVPTFLTSPHFSSCRAPGSSSFWLPESSNFSTPQTFSSRRVFWLLKLYFVGYI